MKLTKKEKSWSERYGTEVRKNMWERNKHLVFFEATSKEGIEQSEKYAEKHGRGWWIFWLLKTLSIFNAKKEKN